MNCYKCKKDFIGKDELSCIGVSGHCLKCINNTATWLIKKSKLNQWEKKYGKITNKTNVLFVD